MNTNHGTEDNIIWSATKIWFNSLSEDVQWGDLTEPERVEARKRYVEEKEAGRI